MGQILKGRPAAKGLDFKPWNEYQLCKEFGWTPKQLREQMADDVELFMAFLNEEREAEKANQKKRKK